MYINMLFICFWLLVKIFTMYFIYKHESIKVTESDLIHLRV